MWRTGNAAASSPQPRRRLDLGADKLDVIVGLALFGVLIVAAAIAADIVTAAGLLIFVAAAFGGFALIVAPIRRSLRRGAIRRGTLDIRIRGSLVLVVTACPNGNMLTGSTGHSGGGTGRAHAPVI